MQTHFDHQWCQAGTRKMNDFQQHRWICGSTASGVANWLGRDPVILPQQLASLRWKTQAPLGTPASMCGWRYYHEGISPADKPQTEELKKTKASKRKRVTQSGGCSVQDLKIVFLLQLTRGG